MEDSALILKSKLREDGFLQPTIVIRIIRDDGSRAKYVWNETEPLPRPLRAREVNFRIKRGRLYHYGKLEFAGLTAILEKKARAYFIETGGLVPLKQNRIYSPERLKRSISNLEQILQRMGFQEAQVRAGPLDKNDRTGDINVKIQVTQGPAFLVRSVRQEVFFPGTNAPADVRTNQINRPYSKWWEQDFSQSIKTNYYHQGYPETSVTIQTEGREPSGTNVFLDLFAQVKTGPRVR